MRLLSLRKLPSTAECVFGGSYPGGLRAGACLRRWWAVPVSGMLGLAGWGALLASGGPSPIPSGQQRSRTAAASLSMAGRPGFLLFYHSASTLERDFVAPLLRDDKTGRLQSLRGVPLSNLDEPTARRFRVKETPALLRLDASGGEVERHGGSQAILAALGEADRGARPATRPPAACQVWRGPRLRWVEERDPRARRVYRRFGGGRSGVPEIFKAMSLRPDLMEKTLDLSEAGHFSEGHLSRRTKEQIATLVSALNGSRYCLGSHAGGLRELGSPASQVAALARADLTGAGLSARERALLAFARRLTLAPGEIAESDIAGLRRHGWRDEQIFEAAFDAALFAFFNRVASTYGLEYPPDGWQPPSTTTLTGAGRSAGPSLSRSPAPPR